MKNKYLIATLLALLASEVPAQRLLVNITIDGLQTDHLTETGKKPSSTGFKRLLEQAMIYQNATYPFAPVDRASAIASLMTGTSPYYNGITSSTWLDRSTLRPIGCVADETPRLLLTSTIGDELKVATKGQAKVFAIANDAEAAILSAGHAADAAFWRDARTRRWKTSIYYSKQAIKWLGAFDILNSEGGNATVTKLALQCIDSNLLGNDDVCDILSVHYDLAPHEDWDASLGNLIDGAESRVGVSNVRFHITGTGTTQEDQAEAYQQFRIPTGIFYINRTSNLLNLYLGAIYGQGKYVEATFRNHIFLDNKLIEQRRLNKQELLARAQSFLKDCDGVLGVKTAHDVLPPHSGDLVVELAPGWSLQNEESNEKYQQRMSLAPVPIIIYGAGVKPQRITAPVTIDRLAPTIANSIHIRAPNACTAQPLF